jgi:hypothetical protein
MGLTSGGVLAEKTHSGAGTLGVAGNGTSRSGNAVPASGSLEAPVPAGTISLQMPGKPGLNGSNPQGSMGSSSSGDASGSARGGASQASQGLQYNDYRMIADHSTGACLPMASFQQESQVAALSWVKGPATKAKLQLLRLLWVELSQGASQGLTFLPTTATTVLATAIAMLRIR